MMAGSILGSLGAWTWLVAAGILMILELAAPGAFMLWFGLAAAGTGIAALVVDLSWQQEVILFAALAVLFVLLGRKVVRRRALTDSPFLNRRAEAFVGRVFVLSDPIVDGTGRVRIDDSVWRIAGADAPVGARVTVTRVDGAVLVVERA
jgi:membrane protein implicated in regulation of membrane protease activity